jgi:hypothetical protein
MKGNIPLVLYFGGCVNIRASKDASKSAQQSPLNVRAMEGFAGLLPSRATNATQPREPSRSLGNASGILFC